MVERSIRVEVSPAGTSGHILVDGHDLAAVVAGIVVSAGVGEVPRLALRLAPRAFVFNADQAVVDVSPSGRGALAVLGWTPPSDVPPGRACGNRCADVERDRVELAAARDALLYLAGEILGHFTQLGHPGRPAVRTGWLSESTVRTWRARLADLTPDPPPDPPDT